MDSRRLQFPAVAPRRDATQPEIAAIKAQFSSLYALSQTNPHVFASPMGPFKRRRHSIWLPRFVFFGPHASDDSWRLAVLGGFSHQDLRSTRALLHVVTTLAHDADDGHGLNLTFFPLVDASGFALDLPERELARQNWAATAEPEVALLARDAKARGYHGFIRVETDEPGEDIATLSLRAAAPAVSSSGDVDLISSDTFEGRDLRFERTHADTSVGPLSLADDLGIQPFELTLRVPAHWPEADYAAAVSQILINFLRSYRAFQAFGGQL